MRLIFNYEKLTKYISDVSLCGWMILLNVHIITGMLKVQIWVGWGSYFKFIKVTSKNYNNETEEAGCAKNIQ